MYVCLCKGITDHQIRDAVAAGAANLKQVSHRLGVARQCGKCACIAKSVIDDAKENDPSCMTRLFYSGI